MIVAEANHTMHLKRWLTSIVALPLLGLLLIKGGILLFAVLIGIVTIVALWEYYQVSGVPLKGGGITSGAFLGFIVGTGIIWGAYKGSFRIMLALIAFNFFLTGLISVLRFQFDPGTIEHINKQVFGLVYVPLFLSSLVLIRNGTAGVAWIFLLLCVVFAGDVAAYYVGTCWGRHKLCPGLSPGKTIEGAVGGLVANLFVGSLAKCYYFQQLPWSVVLFFFLVLGISAQVGDLFESGIKRYAGVKDSGAILPGHGGILDRIDALLFAAPVAYVFKEYILIL